MKAFGCDAVAEIPAHRLPARVPENAFGSGIPIGDFPLTIRHGDGILGGIRDGLHLGFTFQQGLLGLPAGDDAPQAVHQEFQLTEVVHSIRRGLVADSRHGGNAIPAEDGDVHVPENGDVPLWNPFLARAGGGIIVGDDRLPAPHRLTPEARLFHGIDEGLVGDPAGGMGGPGPVFHGQNRLVVVENGEIADPAVRKGNALFNGEGDDGFDRLVGHGVQGQQRFHPLRILDQHFRRFPLLRPVVHGLDDGCHPPVRRGRKRR